jgi:FkbM family methyltransferase
MSLFRKIRLLISIRKRVFKYLTAFGFTGIKILYLIELDQSKEVVELKIPKLKEKIYLRKNTSDIGVFQEIFIDENYHPLLELKNCETILDAGANIGLFALYLLRENPKCRFFCIEPEDSNFELLKMNTANYPNITVLKKALWNSDAYLKFVDPAASKWAFQLVESNDTDYDIHGISIDHLCRNFNLNHIDILKIDIEGSEKEVFEKHTKWLAKVKNLMIEVHEDIRSGSNQSVMDAIVPYSFTMKSINNNYFFTTNSI